MKKRMVSGALTAAGQSVNIDDDRCDSGRHSVSSAERTAERKSRSSLSNSRGQPSRQASRRVLMALLHDTGGKIQSQSRPTPASCGCVENVRVGGTII